MKFVATGQSDSLGGLIDHVRVEAHKASPSITSIPITLHELGNAYSYTVEVDASYDAVSFKLDAAPEGMSITSEGEIIWNEPKQGEYQVRVRVEDGCGGVSTQWYELKVQLPLQCQ